MRKLSASLVVAFVLVAAFAVADIIVNGKNQSVGAGGADTDTTYLSGTNISIIGTNVNLDIDEVVNFRKQDATNMGVLAVADILATNAAAGATNAITGSGLVAIEDYLFSWTDKRDLTVQDPTNGIAYWMSAPWSRDGLEVAEIFVQSWGVTGTVDVVRKYRTNEWYNYDVMESNIVLDADGTADASLSGSSWVSNDYDIGCIINDISAFAITNFARVVFEVTEQ